MDEKDYYQQLLLAASPNDQPAMELIAKPDQPLASHFRTQVTGTVLGGSSSASLTLGVRGQQGIMSNDADGYGNDSINIGVDGHWQTTRTNNSTDDTDVTFTQGFVEPGKTFTLAALVNGPIMTFFLNGHQLTTITDPTYANSYYISFGIVDQDAKTPPTALFSNFSYQELRASQITPTVAVATATAQARQELSQSYTADRPGFHCDNGPGQWQPPTDADLSARCLTNGLALSESATAKYIGSVSFYGLNGNLPKNYRVKAQIDMSGLNGGCAGLNTRVGQQGFYGFYVCSDGSWTIDRYDSNGHGHSLAQGTVAQHSSYVVEATSDGDKQRLSLDGVQVSEVTDRTLNTTDHIELAMMTQQGSAGTAVLSHFVFTPLT